MNSKILNMLVILKTPFALKLFKTFLMFLIFTLSCKLFPIIYLVTFTYSFMTTNFLLKSINLKRKDLLGQNQKFIITIILIFSIVKLVSFFFNFNFLNTIYCQPSKDKGIFNPTITHEMSDETVENMKDSVKEAGDKFAKAIENAADKVSKAITTGNLAGATDYVLKNTNLPSIAKAAVVVSSAAAGSIISSTSSVFENSNPSTSTTSKNEISKDSSSIIDVSPSSPLEDLNFFYETGNHLHNILLNLLGLSIINLFHIYLLILYLFYIFIYNRYDLN